jgi:hypothetical protein
MPEKANKDKGGAKFVRKPAAWEALPGKKQKRQAHRLVLYVDRYG